MQRSVVGFLVSPVIANVLAFAATAVFMAGCATTSPNRPPQVTVNIPAQFQFNVQEQHFLKGDDPFKDQWDPRAAVSALTRFEGFWGSPAGASERTDEGDPIYYYGWTLDAYSFDCPQVRWAYAHAKDGDEAQLSENVDLLSPKPPLTNSGANVDFFARFKRKHFRWGDAVSFFSQSIDDSGGPYAPNNGHLFYEVWGLTHDKRFTVVMRVNVRHPKLSSWGRGARIIAKPEIDLSADTRTFPEAQDANKKAAMAAIQADPDYQLIESCSPTEFEPSLSAVDELVDSIRVR